MKKISELADIQLKKENRTLASVLFIGFLGSACIHAAAMITPVPTLWKPISKESDDIMEIVIDTTKTSEEKVAEIPKEPEPITKIEENQPIETAPLAIALAPETTTPIKEGKDAPAPDQFKPLTTTGASDTKIQQGGGSIIAKDGIGSGFGKAKIPTGFVLGGKINGNPNGKKDGIVGGVSNGKIGGKDPQTTSTFPPAPIDSTDKRPPKLECLSCPKPEYRGKEGMPRVTYDIAPDGRVTNVRLRQSSGDEQTDRETLEAMSKWQFNPQTLPEGGRTNVKVRVTFEESGSQFQRQNEERREERRRETEPQKLVGQEREQPEPLRSLSVPPVIAPVNNNLPISPSLAPVVDIPPAAPQPASVINTPAVPQPASVTDIPPPAPVSTPLLPPPLSKK